ncbi:MAG: TRAP transporter small permease [Desulfobacula sp.]|jgi:TRAP-type C4-dicarboxylate transport system permease small subunit|uniref:TRAP transporter small permease n=1 Tax=Desulfobacula sp. TaxID=2593537 RepID=UPI001DBA9372|nr:TRAP transporter small permease [Desulfobacula sp.]MBT3484950.1 TRAP transporter small permease [Desulfobacula sp.]MBT3803214.1 TRAP transporter small permease [Desulfobacula sp.]MBT4024597.1 TRAP transporter small permease [Desulfobacula sp.]MBT4197579.1 TRAP transporter small permease [Desulfobacula sp.]
MTSKRKSFSQNIVKLLQTIEDGILIGLLLLMIFVAVLQIFLRNLFDSGILWGDPLVRTLVLWIGLIGAMVASRNNHHISIDVISRYLPDNIKKLTDIIISIFTSLVCAVMAYYSLVFVVMEKNDGALSFAAVPAWICESIIPVSFAIISFRYILFSLTSITKLFKPIPR